MSCHRTLRFAFSILAALAVFASSASKARALTEANIPTIGYDNPSEMNCPPFASSVGPGSTAWISDWNSKPLTMYAKAAYGSFQMADYPPREVVNIRSKPVCVQGDAWIRIEYWGNEGWAVAVNRDGSYNLIPVQVADLNRTF